MFTEIFIYNLSIKPLNKLNVTEEKINQKKTQKRNFFLRLAK